MPDNACQRRDVPARIKRWFAVSTPTSAPPAFGQRTTRQLPRSGLHSVGSPRWRGQPARHDGARPLVRGAARVRNQKVDSSILSSGSARKSRGSGLEILCPVCSSGEPHRRHGRALALSGMLLRATRRTGRWRRSLRRTSGRCLSRPAPESNSRHTRCRTVSSGRTARP